MSTPSELVTDAFSQAYSYVSTHQGQLASFTSALNAAVQNAPLFDITFSPVAEPGAAAAPTYVEPGTYGSDLLTSITDSLTDRMAGGTGLAPSVESALWDRARERELVLAQGNIDAITRDSEALGWALPPGVLVDAVARETRGYYDKISTISRDIVVKQAELEQVNLQKVFDQAVSFEGVLADIAFKRAEASTSVFRAQVDRFKAEVEQDVKHWETNIKQYEAQITYTLHGQKLNSEIVRANSGAGLDAAKVGMQAYAQLLASSYGLIHASASVSAGANMSVSYSYSNDTSGAVPSVTAV